MWQLLAAEAVKKKMNNSNSSKSTSSNKGGGGFFSDIPGWAKGIVIIIIIAIIAFITYKLFKKYFSETGASDREDVKDAQSDLNDLKKNGIIPSYNQSQYSNWANTLKTSFDGCGTQNDAWQRIFNQMKNDADVLALIATYGVRTYDGCNWEGDFNDKTGTLSAGLQDELSSGELGKLNKLLSDKNIKHQF